MLLQYFLLMGIVQLCRSIGEHLKILKLSEIMLEIKHVSCNICVIANGGTIFDCMHPYISVGFSVYVKSRMWQCVKASFRKVHTHI